MQTTLRLAESHIASNEHRLSLRATNQAVFGNRLKLHPVVVLFGLVFWNMLVGVSAARYLARFVD